MATPREPQEVRLLVGILFPDNEYFSKAKNKLENIFGRVIDTYGPQNFNHTTYYKKEMGDNLKRAIFVFDKLVKRQKLFEIKLATNEIENALGAASSQNSIKRLVNLDPGILSLENFILASCKGYAHRIYLSKGVYADLTLIFKNNSYRLLDWTYPDYGEGETILFLNKVRLKYKELLDKGSKG